MKFVSPVSTVSTVDFSGAASTKPVKAGTSLPASCGVGEMYFKTDSAAGQNLHLATATNTWTQIVPTGNRTVLHHAYNTDVVGDNSAGQVWATYTIPGGTLEAGDIVEVRCQIRKTAGTTDDKNIGNYFGNGVMPAFGMSVETGKQYVYWIDWIVASTTTAIPTGFRGNVVATTGPGEYGSHAIDASSLNLANDIDVKMQTTSSGQLDNTNTIKVVVFTVTLYRPA